MSPRQFRSESEWQALVDKYDNKSIEQSKSEYCRKEGISASSFCKWYKQLSRKSSKFINLPIARTPYQAKHFWVKVFGIKIIRLELDVCNQRRKLDV